MLKKSTLFAITLSLLIPSAVFAGHKKGGKGEERSSTPSRKLGKKCLLSEYDIQKGYQQASQEVDQKNKDAQRSMDEFNKKCEEDRKAFEKKMEAEHGNFLQGTQTQLTNFGFSSENNSFLNGTSNNSFK